MNNMKKCVVLQVNDAAVRMRLVIFGSKVLYSSSVHRLQNLLDGGRGERRLTVLADGHLVLEWGRPTNRYLKCNTMYVEMLLID